MSDSPRKRLRPTKLDRGIFLLSFAVLLMELLLTRIFSVVMFHHLSFLAVSLAMMGLGLGGLLVNLAPNKFRLDNVAATTSTWAIVFAVGVIAAGGIAFNMPIDMAPSAANWTKVLIVLLACLIPFTAGGIIIAHLLSRHAEATNRLYCFDLIGAGFACLAFIPMTNWLGAPTALLFTAAIAAWAGYVLAGTEKPLWRRVCMIAAVAALLSGLTNLKYEFYDINYTHGGKQAPTLVRRWNSFSRVEVMGRPEDLQQRHAPISYGYSSELAGVSTKELYLKYDASALTQIVGFNGQLSEVEYLQYDVASAPYHVRRLESALIIGAGGGRDVLTALSTGVRNVTGVEINGLTVDLMRDKFKDFVGGLYSDYPGVKIFRDDGRNFVRSSKEKYDLIQASLVDTWAASSAGAYALVENSLYTVDAFVDYLSRLTDDGMVSFSRWHNQPPEEILRVVVLGQEALRRQGITDATRHLAIVRTRSELTHAPSLATIIFKKSPFTDDECSAILRWTNRMQFAIEYLPPLSGFSAGDPIYAKVLGPESSSFLASVNYDLSLVDDNRPFFFDRVPLLSWLMHRLGANTITAGAGQLTLGGQTLLIALVATAACTLLLFFVPLIARLLFHKRKISSAQESSQPLHRALGWAIYFACLGLGFIAIEIVLIQRLNLYLGNPVYALSVVMFTMLICSGLGSYAAGKYRDTLTLPVALIAVVCILAVYGFGQTKIIEATLGTPSFIRILVAVLTIAPLAFVMGMPFPTGLRLASLESSSIVSWAWAINGGASVFGSVLTVLISMSFGFSKSFLVGTIIYGIALGTVSSLSSSARKKEITS